MKDISDMGLYILPGALHVTKHNLHAKFEVYMWMPQLVGFNLFFTFFNTMLVDMLKLKLKMG